MYRVNMAAAAWKARKLNDLLPDLQEKFESALSQGTLLSLESAESSWLDDELQVDA